jgi:lipoprotein-anchoring transpeptidase ErfK/SrfK
VRRAIVPAAALAAAAALLVPAAGVGATAPLYGVKPKPLPKALAKAPTARRAWVARVLHPVQARAVPRPGGRRATSISPYAPYDRGPQTLLVLGSRASRADGVWYRVLLPKRPNTSSAWVPAAAVRVTPTPWRVRVSLGARRAQLLRAGRVLARWTVAIGTPIDPTPVGRFAVSEVVPQADPAGFFGPAILTLTAHSVALSDFDGGDGRVAMHGTNLPNLLGQAASHGCIRFPNAAARRLAAVVPPGAPVDVVR